MLRPRGYTQQKSSQDPQILQPGVKIPSIQQPTGIKHPSFQSCDVPVAHRVPCGGRGITAAECDAISCCFDGQQCFFGKAVTVQCTKDAQFIVVVARDATLPHLDLETISLMGTGDRCSHVDSNAGFAIYQFPVTACGTVVMEEPGVIIYENRMASSFEVDSGLYGVVTRDSYYELLFQCRYTGTSVETLVVEVLPIDNPPPGAAAMGPIRVHLRLANGQCASKGCNELDVVYTSFFTDADYPVTKVLRDPVYVEVQLLEKADPNLVLVLDRCWATMAEHPHSLPQWDILVNGCPYRDDRYLSQLVPIDQSSGLNFPSHYKRFLFKMFTFVEDSSLTPLHEHVYIHCSTAVCSSAVQNCEHSCFRKQRDVEAVMEMADEPKVVATKPYYLREPSKTCEVPSKVRIPCGGTAISVAGCEAINCCFDGSQCYFGKAVTVQCTKDAQFIVVVARDANLPHLDLKKISLLREGGKCSHVDSNSAFAIYQFPVTTCGTIITVYIHCSTAVCIPAPGRNCEPPCLRNKRDVEAVREMAGEPKVVATVGPVMMSKPEDPAD
ncbi:zona pellucida sperm-binding protein 4-like [Aulostomus maculatus]